MRFSHWISVVVVAAAVALSPALAMAGERVNTDGDEVAIRGFDTVAYFTEGRPVEGSPQYQHRWQDARWQFSTPENRDLFASEPERYAPRYGGYCAGAMAAGLLRPIDPEAWAIVDGRLYLNFRKEGRDRFVVQPGPLIEQADANWQALGVVE